MLPAGGPPWWQAQRDELQLLSRDEHGDAAYVYDRGDGCDAAAEALLRLDGRRARSSTR